MSLPQPVETLWNEQWWQLQARHDGIHLAQIRDVKRAPGFPNS